jgi:hypothetical protein
MQASAGRAVVRTLALPLSFLFLRLGFAGILLGDRRRALHDVIAGTAVIYSWDARAARLRFLSRGDHAAASCPSGSSSGLVRRLLGHRVGVLNGDSGAFWPNLPDRDADFEDSLVVPGGDIRGVDLGGEPDRAGE